jgi:hypothetical protein
VSGSAAARDGGTAGRETEVEEATDTEVEWRPGNLVWKRAEFDGWDALAVDDRLRQSSNRRRLKVNRNWNEGSYSRHDMWKVDGQRERSDNKIEWFKLIFNRYFS